MRSRSLVLIAVALAVAIAVGLLREEPEGAASNPQRAVARPNAMAASDEPVIAPHPEPELALESDGLRATPAPRAAVEVDPTDSARFRLSGEVVVRRRVDDRWEFEDGLDGRLILRATPAGARDGAVAPVRVHEFEVAVEGGRFAADFALGRGVAAATVDVLEGELDSVPVYGVTAALEVERGVLAEAWRILVARGATATVRVVDRDTGEPLDGAVIVRGKGQIVAEDRHPGLAALRPVAGPARPPLEVPTRWSVARGEELGDAFGFLVGADGYAWEWIPTLFLDPGHAVGAPAASPAESEPAPRTVTLARGGSLRVVVADRAQRGLPLVLHVHDDPDLAGPPVIEHAFEGTLDARFDGVPVADLRVRIGDGRRWRKTPPLDEVEVRSRPGETVDARLVVPEIDPIALHSFEVRIVLSTSGWPADWVFDDLALRLLDGGDGAFGYAPLEFGERTVRTGGAFEVASSTLRLGAGRYALEGYPLGSRIELSIEGPGDQVVELGPPCSLRVDLVDDATGAPLPEFTLHSGSRPFGKRIQVEGTGGSLLLPDGRFVSAAGTEAGRYTDAPASFRVFGPAGPTELRVRLPLGAERVDPDGVRWIPGLYAERTVELTPESDRLELRLHRGLVVVVRPTVSGGDVGFPPSRPLDDLATLEGSGSLTSIERWGRAAVLRVDRPGDYRLRIAPSDGPGPSDATPVSITADQPVELEIPLSRDRWTRASAPHRRRQ